MPQYARKLFSGKKNTTLLLLDGSIIKVNNDLFHLWEKVEGTEVERVYLSNHIRVRRTKRQIEEDNINGVPNNKFVNPQDENMRVYKKILHRGKGKSVKVLTTQGEVVYIPSEYFNTWKSEYEFEQSIRTIDDIRFGIEIEFIADETRLSDFNQKMISILGHKYIDHHLNHYVSDGDHWVLGTDSSVTCTSQHPRYLNYQGYELVSPILKFDEETFSVIREVMNVIKDVFHGEVNRTCGQHVHFSGFCKELSDCTSSECANLVSKSKEFFSVYGSLENSIFDRLVAPSRRSSNNNYAYSCLNPRMSNGDYSRYNKINLNNFHSGRIGTIENRQHQGTLEAKKIWCWIELNARLLLSFFTHEHVDYPTDMIEFFSFLNLSQFSTSYLLQRAEEFSERNI